jgi:hypothetical protein
MKTKLLKKLRKEAKENIYLSPSPTQDDMICIIFESIDEQFGLTQTFYDGKNDIFRSDTIVNYNSVIDALLALASARRYYILNLLHSKYRAYSKGQEKRNEMERLKREDYQKYLRQF